MFREEHRKEFTTYVATTRPRLRRRAYMLCGDWYEADDLVQDTFAVMYRQWPRLKRTTELDGYTWTVLVRSFLSVRRRLRWRREILQSDPPDRQRELDDSVDVRIPLLAELGRLPPRQRAVVVLRFWADLSIDRTAAILCVSPGTVASQTHKALATLRTSLVDLR
ncbi:MAG TPA: SigE family RNA polymerase sigma factor [Pseudonocardiaceae bacterium]|jgi:RNA polymerase sigma-70 factor (sigma-E family)|nr:SigE family RNA polymerase sigma factor [Pseudonocardiaceae bacterium]